jgi:N-acetyl-gamma-glutamyl-phosphate reductase
MALSFNALDFLPILALTINFNIFYGFIMTAKIFIDGEHGTTGLQIISRLSQRDDINLLSISHEDRRDPDIREAKLREADIAILCLPDSAAREAVALAADAGTRFIDASTAHRTHPDWVFGFGELNADQKQAISSAQFVSNPGCYSTGAIALIAPLVQAGLLPADYPLTINAISGYSGGGKQMIAQMENSDADDAILSAHFSYALTLAHKHVPEIVTRSGLTRKPVFTPSVGRFAQGMLVHVPLHLDLLKEQTDLRTVYRALRDHYQDQEFVQVVPLTDSAELTRLDPEQLAGTDVMRLYVFGIEGDGRVNLTAQLDNLGKGASGAAVQNLDLMLECM